MTDEETNIFPIAFEEAKEYLEQIHEILLNLAVGKQVFDDYTSALEAQHAKNNEFINWTIRNYYKVTILDLCKLVEKRKTDEERWTLQHFINLLRDPLNYQMLETHMKSATVPVTNLETGEISQLDVGTEKLEILKKINFQNDLDIIEDIHGKLKGYRNHKLCHNHPNVDALSIKICELHDFIEKLIRIFERYFHVFGVSVDYDSIKKSNYYGNFHLYLK